MNKPYYRRSEGLENGVYIRVGRHTLRANADLSEELKWQSRRITFDTLSMYQASVELDIDRRKVAQVMATLDLPRSTAGRRLAALTRAKLIVKKGEGRGARYRRAPPTP